MKSTQSGFTLIELVVVIVILGILAVSAVPRIIDLQDDARDAALQGVIGAVNAASAINYAGAVAGDGDALAVDAGTTTCDGHIEAIVTTVDWTNDYTVSTGAIGTDGDAAGTAVTSCTITDANDGTVSDSPTVIVTTP